MFIIKKGENQPTFNQLVRKGRRVLATKHCSRTAEDLQLSEETVFLILNSPKRGVCCSPYHDPQEA